jgi:flavin-dependent dehydrogenase
MEASLTIAATLSLEEAAVRLWDVLVVGAGPAGSLTARELARRGQAVLLVDRSPFPRWKVCGSCLSARALSTLAQVGLGSLTRQCQAVPLGHLHLAARSRSVVLSLPEGAALSREAFDGALVQSAVAAGAAFLPETYATLTGITGGIRMAFLRQGARELLAGGRIIVAADGLSGRLLAGEPGVRMIRVYDSRIGAGVVAPYPPGGYERGTIYMACGAVGYVGLVRLEDDTLDIAAALDRRAMQHAGGPAILVGQMLEEAGWPAVPSLKSLAWRGTPAMTRRATRVAGERLFVVGDSAGYVEPFTGEGMAWALEAAAALAPLAAEGAEDWTPRLAARWSSVFHHMIGDRRASRTAAAVLRHPVLTRGVIGILERFPSLGQPVIRRLNRRPAQKAVRA